jgi:glycosyltransferase involved in cell wall biosynthesis
MTLSVVQVIGNSVVGGAERHLLDLVQGLTLYGVDVEVICPRPGPLTDQLAACGIPVQCIELIRSWHRKEYVLNWGAVERLISVLEKKRPDVLHSHLFLAHLHASLAGQRAGIQAIVYTAHTAVVRPENVLLSYITSVRTIAVSRAVAYFLTDAGVPDERIEVIRNGVGAHHFEENIEAQQSVQASLCLGRGPIIGTVSRLSSEKGIDVLLRAVQQVKKVFPSIIVLIIGDGPQAAELHLLTKQLNLNETIRFLGVRTDIAILNRLLDVFVLPSREEAFSIALLEAMAAGKAVIATDIDGTPEIVTHGVDGWLVEADDPQSLAQALIMLLEDPALRAAMGSAAQLKAAIQFTLDRMIRETLSFYRHLLRGTSSW